VEPAKGPSGNEGPGFVPPEMSDEFPDGLINDDLLEDNLLREMRHSFRQVYKHHVVMLTRSSRGILFFLSRICLDSLFLLFLQKLARRSQIKSSDLAVMSERLQQFPALKQELMEKDDLIASLTEQLATAQGERN